MKTTTLFKSFFNSEKSAGLLLIFCTILSLSIANSTFGSGYHHFWETEFCGHNLKFWINDGLMTIFFLLIGLELELEVYNGELSKLKDALLPIFAALGGMVVPAAIYLYFNFGTVTQAGAGIPMATDIAFALGILSLLSKRVPLSLKIFLTALAVIDDLGAIIVIAIFYTKTIFWNNLAIAGAIFVLLLALNRLKVRNLIPYLTLGFAMWYFMLSSGVHATITGVLLAFAIPFGDGSKKSTSYVLQNALHKPVTFIILPIFVLANTAIIISSNFADILSQKYSLGIAFGLILGKPIGIFTATFIAVKLKFCKLPSDLNWRIVLAVGFLAGIGFTMSMFVTLLAFNDAAIIINAKITIFIASLIAGIIGFCGLYVVLKQKN